MNMRQVWVTFLAALCAVFIAMPKAQAAGRGIDRATGQALWDAAVNGKTTTIGNGQNAMKVIKPPVKTTGTPTSNGAGGATVTDTMTVPVGAVNVPVSATTNVTKDAIVNGATTLLTSGSIPLAVVAASMPLLSDWMNKSKVRLNPDTGAPEFMPDGCYTGPCWEYGVGVPSATSEWVRDILPACQKWVANFNVANPSANRTLVSTSGSGSSGTCNYKDGNGGTFPSTRTSRSVSPLSPTWYPPTPQQIKDALYKNDPAPPIIDEFSKYGNIIWPGPESVSGPSAITGPKETSVSSGPSGTSTTVSQASTPITYSGPNVTAGNTTKTTTTTNPDGSTSTTTTTTEPGTDPADSTGVKDETVDPPTDTALPPVPDLYTRKYPDGMVGIWNTTKTQLAQSPLMQLKDQLMPSLPSSGSCPVFTVPADLAVWAPYGMLDVSPPCWVWDFGRLVVIISALLLARALIFGG